MPYNLLEIHEAEREVVRKAEAARLAAEEEERMRPFSEKAFTAFRVR